MLLKMTIVQKEEGSTEDESPKEESFENKDVKFQQRILDWGVAGEEEIVDEDDQLPEFKYEFRINSKNSSTTLVKSISEK